MDGPLRTPACSTCGRAIGRRDGACPGCNERSLERVRKMQEMGGGNEGIRQCDKVPMPLKIFAGSAEDAKAFRARLWLIRRMIAGLPCSGNTAIWKDDASGATGSWDRVVRLCEEQQ